jgi:hypothetical protein
MGMKDPHPPAPFLLCFHGREARPEQSASPKWGEGEVETSLLAPAPFSATRVLSEVSLVKLIPVTTYNSPTAMPKLIAAHKFS